MVRSLICGVMVMCWASFGWAGDAMREFSDGDKAKADGAVQGQVLPGGPAGTQEQLHRDGWWTDQSGGWIGGIGGGLIGVLGGTIGVLAGCGKARRFVLALTAVLILVGAICLIVGAVAWALGQPYAVYYPLLLGGAILVFVCGLNLPALRRRYQQMELQKMAAMDAGVRGIT